MNAPNKGSRTLVTTVAKQEKKRLKSCKVNNCKEIPGACVLHRNEKLIDESVKADESPNENLPSGYTKWENVVVLEAKEH